MRPLLPLHWLVALLAVCAGASTGGVCLVSAPRSVVTPAVVAILTAIAVSAPGVVLLRRVRRSLRVLTGHVGALAVGSGSGPVVPVGDAEADELAAAIGRLQAACARRLNDLRDDRNNLQGILAGMIEGVVAVDLGERVLHINRSARTMLRLPDGRVIGRPLWEHCIQHRVNEGLRTVLTDGQRLQCEIRLTLRERDRYIDMRADAFRDRHGRIAGAMAVLHDITEYRQLEQVRRDFVANASHELKTPLTVILSVVETIIDDGEMPVGTRLDFLRRIQGQGQRLNLIINDLLALSRLENARTEIEHDRFDAVRLVRSICVHLQPAVERKRLTLSCYDDEQPVILEGQMSAIRTAVENVVDNAVKYTGEGGCIEVSCLREGDRCLIAVADDGIGITPADQQRIFERFYRVDKARSRELGGTGLGLAIAKHVVLAHGGELQVDSSPGSGSNFSIILPVADADGDHGSDPDP